MSKLAAELSAPASVCRTEREMSGREHALRQDWHTVRISEVLQPFPISTRSLR